MGKREAISDHDTLSGQDYAVSNLDLALVDIYHTPEGVKLKAKADERAKAWRRLFALHRARYEVQTAALQVHDRESRSALELQEVNITAEMDEIRIKAREG